MEEAAAGGIRPIISAFSLATNASIGMDGRRRVQVREDLRIEFLSSPCPSPPRRSEGTLPVGLGWVNSMGPNHDLSLKSYGKMKAGADKEVIEMIVCV